VWKKKKNANKPVEMGDAALSTSLPSIHLAPILHHNPLYTIEKKIPGFADFLLVCLRVS
jgi:hypothetical protein